MTTELTMLYASAVLALFQFVPYTLGYLRHWGFAIAAGNRADTPPLPAWAERSIRAHRNMTENLVHFAAIVLVAKSIGVSNEVTAVGASLFFYARLIYAIVYTAGIPWLRTFVFAAGVAGELMVASQVLTAGG